jgi:hypothetical protein
MRILPFLVVAAGSVAALTVTTPASAATGTLSRVFWVQPHTEAINYAFCPYTAPYLASYDRSWSGGSLVISSEQRQDDAFGTDGVMITSYNPWHTTTELTVTLTCSSKHPY